MNFLIIPINDSRWHSRKVLSWELSNTLDGAFCISALKQALAHRQPEIFNTDQGAQFTSQAFTEVLQASQIAISMDGRGRALDNVFVERLWRTVKYEDTRWKGDDRATVLPQPLACRREMHRTHGSRTLGHREQLPLEAGSDVSRRRSPHP